MAQLGFWLLWAISVFLMSGTLFFMGARESVLEISSLGWGLIIATAICSGVLITLGMVRTSRSGSVDTALVYLRKLHTGAWLLRVTATSLTVAALVALFSWMWIHVAIRNLSAASSEIGGEVVDFSRTGLVNRLCRYQIHVRLDNGHTEKICAERGIIHRTTPAFLLALKEHDKVVVTLRSNALGISAAITGSAVQ